MSQGERVSQVADTAAVLLAAGESTRMESPKQLVEWRGVPLVQYQTTQLLAAGVAEVVVVAGHRAAEVLSLIEGCPANVHHVINHDYRNGKTTSIKAGLGALRTTPRAVMLLAVDQPRTSAILRRLIDEHLRGEHPVSMPSHGSRHGHPPIFSGSLLPELLRISEEQMGVREVIERHRDTLHSVPIDDPLVLTNINTAEDYRKARELAGDSVG